MHNPLLYPLAVTYGFLTFLRNKFFDWRLLKSIKFSTPVIAIGNLCAGGTGKTPHVEYLVKILEGKYTLAILSRGYKRTTRGFIQATSESTEREIGDEPRQFKRKFKDHIVAVDENRVRGIEKIIKENPDTDVILLDDAFQHRYVNPGLNILLTDYHFLYTDDFMLPYGMLREHISGARRADIIIVTKTPKIFSPIIRRNLIEKISPKEYQKIYFSYITYDEPVPFSTCKSSYPSINPRYIVLATAIANPYPLQEYLATRCSELVKIEYDDHHRYSEEDVRKITDIYRNILGTDKVILTTEKDSTKLDRPEYAPLLENIPIFYVPVRVEFHRLDESRFDKQVIDYVEKNRRHSTVHKKENI